MSDRACGVDIGGTKIEAVVVDHGGHVDGKARIATPTVDGPESVVEAIIAAIGAAAKAAKIAPSELRGIGLGAPGAVNADAGILVHAPNIPGFQRPYPLAQRVREACSAPVYLGNDVAVAVLGERDLGAGRDFQSFIGIWWGTGVGGGIVLDREFWRGRGAAGEIGHTVVERDGRPEAGGLVGTMEAYAGRRSMELRAREALDAGRETRLFALMEQAGKDRLSSRVWQDALAEGDALAEELIADALDAIAVAAANAVNLLDLEAVILGGGLGTRFGQPMADRLAVAMRPRLYLPDQAPVVTAAALGDAGGAIGASLLVPAA